VAFAIVVPMRVRGAMLMCRYALSLPMTMRSAVAIAVTVLGPLRVAGALIVVMRGIALAMIVIVPIETARAKTVIGCGLRRHLTRSAGTAVQAIVVGTPPRPMPIGSPTPRPSARPLPAVVASASASRWVSSLVPNSRSVSSSSSSLGTST
jgi:hypothetical protein